MPFGHGEYILRALKRGATKPNIERILFNNPDLNPRQVWLSYEGLKTLDNGYYIGMMNLPDNAGTLLVRGTSPNLHFDVAYHYPDFQAAFSAYAVWDGEGHPPDYISEVSQHESD